MRLRAGSIGAAFALGLGLVASASALPQEERERALLCGGCERSLFALVEPGTRTCFFRGGTELGVAVADAEGWAVLRREAPFEPGEIRVELLGLEPRRSAAFALAATRSSSAEPSQPRFETWIEESAQGGARALIWRVRSPLGSEGTARPGALGELAIRTERGRAVHRATASIDAEGCARGRWSLPREARAEALVLGWRVADAEAEATSRVAEALAGARTRSRATAEALEVEIDRSVIAEDEVFDLRAHTCDAAGRAAGCWIAWELRAGSELLSSGRLLTAMALGTAAWSVDPPRAGALHLLVRREDGRGAVCDRELFQSGASDAAALRWLDEPGAWRVGRELAVRWNDRDGAHASALVVADADGRFLWGVALPAARGARRAIVRPTPSWEREVELVLVHGSGARLDRRQAVERPLDVALELRAGGSREVRVEVRDAEGRPAQAALAFACFDAQAESRCRFADAGVRLDAKGGAWIALPPALAGSFVVRALAVDRDGREGAAELAIELEEDAHARATPPQTVALLASGWGEWIGTGAVALPPPAEGAGDFELELASAAAPALWAEEHGRDEERSDLSQIVAQALLQLELAAAWPRGASGRSEVVIAARASARRAFERLACAWDELANDESASRLRVLAARMLPHVDDRHGPIDEGIRRALEAIPREEPLDSHALPAELLALARAIEDGDGDGAAFARAFAAALVWDARAAPAEVRLARAELLLAAERRPACAPSAGAVDLRWNERALSDRLDLWGPVRRIEVPRSYRASNSDAGALDYAAEGRPRVLWRIWSRSR